MRIKADGLSCSGPRNPKSGLRTCYGFTRKQHEDLQLRREFPDADWPVAEEVPVHLIDRRPKGHHDEVIVFTPTPVTLRDSATEAKGLKLRRFRGAPDMQRFPALTDL